MNVRKPPFLPKVAAIGLEILPTQRNYTLSRSAVIATNKMQGTVSMAGLTGRIAALGDVAKVGIGPFAQLCKMSFLCIGDVVGP